MILSLFLLTEILSYIGFASSIANPFIFGFFVLTALFVTVYKLEYGILLVAAELLISSFGYLIYLDLNGSRLSLRIILWLIVMAVFFFQFLWQLIKERNQSFCWKNLKDFVAWKWFFLLAFFILISLINAIFRGNDLMTIFADFNAWLYFLMLLPVIAVYSHSGNSSGASQILTNKQPSANLGLLLNIFFAASLWLSLKTLFLLFVFTHNLSIGPEIYTWLRRTLVGEMTPTASGWPRVFLQGQIYPVVAFLIIFWRRAQDLQWKEFFKINNWPLFVAASLFLSSVLISFSRSFWLGLAVVMSLSFILLWSLNSFKKMMSVVSWAILSLLGSFLIIYLVAAWPYWNVGGGSNFRSELVSRVTVSGEAALVSRWSLLPVLSQAILKEPLFGQGYGATVTYFSSDPRVLENNPSGQYTTYAFEWGYLDIWLKLGLAGLLAYLILLWQILSAAWQQGLKQNNYLWFGIGAALVFLAVTNFFTPYLNHPLGIGAIIAGSCLIWLNKVY